MPEARESGPGASGAEVGRGARWRAGVRRYGRRVLVVAAGLAGAALASLVTIDLGPALRTRAERAATAFLKRPMHIGRLSLRPIAGEVVLEEVVIDGVAPGARPFLRAGRIVVAVPWWTAFTGELVVESVRMTDWDLAIETFADGRHSLPNLTPARREAGGRRLAVTVREVWTDRGQFTFVDHGTPWGVVCRNLSVSVVRADGEYRGRASFAGGTVWIQDFVPMRAALRTAFVIRGGAMHLPRIELETDGAESILTGEVDFRRWPEQRYQVQSRVNFPRMRELFFAGETWRLAGEGTFTGTFHVYRGGRDLLGEFASARAAVNDYVFEDLRGRLVWVPGRFEVPEARARFFGGRLQFAYTLAPIGAPGGTPATFEARYDGVDLDAFTRFLQLSGGLRLEGRASGRHRLEWPLGRIDRARGEGEITAVPPAGVRLAARELGPEVALEVAAREPAMGPFNPDPVVAPVPVGGTVRYRYDPSGITFAPSTVATPATFVAFEGRTAYGADAMVPFHVTSRDWQESDRLLAAVLTAAGSPTRAVPVGGFGEFDGVLRGAFRAPRVEGRFRGMRMRAWDVEWGEATARVVVENQYADVADGVVVKDDSRIAIEGRFSLGYPRRDGGDELDARARVERRPLADLRHAFGLDDYDITGWLSGEFHLYGHYERPFGFGRVTIEDAVAYGERFPRASGSLRFEGVGVRIDGVEIAKGTGTITGAAYLDWQGQYSFSADGRRIPVEEIQAAAWSRAPLSGLLQFTASGTGSVDAPRYEVRGRVADLFAGDEGIGQVTGRVSVRGEVLTLELEAASPRLAVFGSGRIALTPEADAELSVRFVDTSLDPYLRFFEPRLSPFTTLVASGTLRVAGELADPAHLRAAARVEAVRLELFDYPLRNDGAVDLALEGEVVRIERLRLVGEGTRLEVSGQVPLGDAPIAVTARGDANLGILQGFFRNLRSSGAAEVVAELGGSRRAPVVSGYALVTDGRIRHFALPHGLEAINGRVAFDAQGIHFDDPGCRLPDCRPVTARLGGGEVRFGGRIVLSGYVPSAFALTAVGERMRLRYPEGFRSEVDADLRLTGPIAEPLLSGTVTVRDAVFVRRFEGGAEWLGLGGEAAGPPAAPAAASFPLRYDVRIVAPSTLRIANNLAQIVSSADLTLAGTYDRPVLLGRAEIERGEVSFEGNRYRVTRGTIDFFDPARIQPFFDIEAETQVRVPGQTYRVTFRAAGTPERFVPEFSSDPPLPAIDVVSLLLGDVYNPQDAEIRELRTRERSETALMTGAARLLASPISAGVGRAVEQTLGFDTVQIAPFLGTTQSLNPAARLTIGKRLSSRVFLTYSRALNAAYNEQIILLEYDQSDRISWVVSQNEDRTYALDVRVRHVF
jgi:hypothetical protein